MPITAPPTLTPAGLSPDRADRPTFVARSIARDDFIKNTQIPELQLAIDNVYQNAVETYNNSVTAESSAIAATAATGVTKWVSGTTYAQGENVWSPVDFLTYRRKVAGAGTTDPSSDSSNWAAINYRVFYGRNDIVNGDFRIAQAGTSFAAPASDAYDLDGWINGKVGTTTVFTIEQVQGSTAGRLARRVTITTADTSVAAGDIVIDYTKIEGYNIEKYVGNTFTVAFRAKVPVTGIHCVALRNSGSDRSYVKEINFPAANTWQDCSFTVTGGLPTAGTWNYTNGTGLTISFTHMCGTTFQTTPDAWQTGSFVGTSNQVNDCATVSNVWALEKVTMNLGTVAAVSETSYEQELARCQRYYETGNIYYENYASLATNPVGVTGVFKQPKRAAPTLVYSAFTSLQNAAQGATRNIYTDSFERYALSVAAGVVTARETWVALSRL